ncbi:unnamed protein product, partial [Staurois parvus]
HFNLSGGIPECSSGKVSVAKALTLSYTRAYHARCSGICSSLTSSCAPAMSPLQCPRQCNRWMPASVFWVPFPATSGRTGDGTGGKFENDKK